MLVKVFFSYTNDDYKIAFRTTNESLLYRGSVIEMIFDRIRNHDLENKYLFDFYSYKNKDNTEEYPDIYVDKAKRCNAFVIFPSDSYFKSSACLKELFAFLEESQNKKVYTLYMNRTTQKRYVEYAGKRRSILAGIKNHIYKFELWNNEFDAIYKDTKNELLYMKVDAITKKLETQLEEIKKFIKKSIVIASNSSNNYSEKIISKVKSVFRDSHVIATPIFTDEKPLMDMKERQLINKRAITNQECLRNGSKVIFFLNCNNKDTIEEAIDEMESCFEDTVIILRNSNDFDVEQMVEDFFEESPPNWYYKDYFDHSDLSNLLTEFMPILK